ncbi:esterase family protein [Myxococcota bacterium]|nr:esterase family protein [Myxococcota bacterium]MBU1431137.1 esterase family protein [Myxococcota bacterium]MBU1899771.1 esterase family protein [Myxococcota bacterium]
MPVAIFDVESALLANNPLGDPTTRQIPVYTPPGLAEGQRVPALYALAGFTGTGLSFLNYNFYSPNLPQLLDQLIASGEMPPAVVVMVDGMTALGGNQYIDSPAVGPWASHICQELIPWVEARFPVIQGREGRGVFGSSSGGYGALMMGLERAEHFSAIASHAGDTYFNYCYQADFPHAAGGLLRVGGLTRWLETWRGYDQLPGWAFPVANVVAMSAFYSPNPSAPHGFDLPFDQETGVLDEAVFARWLERDPVRLVARHQDALRALRQIYIDVGRHDEYHLQYGNRVLKQRLEQAGVAHHYEEFDGGHRGISYRYRRSLPMLARALTP